MPVVVMNTLRNQSVPYLEILDPRETILICSSKQTDNRDGYLDTIAMDHYEDDHALDEVVRKIHRETPITCLIAKAEVDLVRAARIREDLEIPGQWVASAKAYRDKFLMKCAAKKGGVQISNFGRVSSRSELSEFHGTHGFPIVVKPLSGSGGEGTFVLKSEKEVDLACVDGRIQLGTEFLVESFVSGRMAHVDGIVREGRLIFFHPSIYLSSCLSYQDLEYQGSLMLDATDELCERLGEFTQKVVDSLPTPPITAVHCEVFIRPDGSLVLCEIASRTGGARINDMIRAGTGVDMDRIVIGAQAGLLDPEEEVLRSCFKTRKVLGFGLVPPRGEVFVRGPRTTPPSYVLDFRVQAKEGEFSQKAKKSADWVASFLVEGANTVGACEWFDRESIWESRV